ncbi:hypothetical protein GCM10028818_22940 [Spirosoma horti]
MLKLAAQPLIYVTPDGAGNRSGSSWIDALPGSQLQSRLAMAVAGTQIWVANGVYKPTGNTDRTISFTMHNKVALYGGFVGNETSLSQRPLINLSSPSSSTLSGDIGTIGNDEDNSCHVIKNIDLDSTAVLDCFVITRGNASIFQIDSYGGGILNNALGEGHYCSPTIRNCHFINNQASSGGAVNNYAPNSGKSNPAFINCSFSYNTGGAVTNIGRDGGESSPQFINCLFSHNTSPNSGGAMSNNGSYSGKASPSLINCAFSQNSAIFQGGAIYFTSEYGGDSSPQFYNCSFSRNTASQSQGGAIAFEDNKGTAKLIFTNCIVWGNSSPRGTTPGIKEPLAPLTYTYSDIQPNVGNASVRPGVGNISIDPIFVDAGSDNLQLKADSPCINTGTPTADTMLVKATDLASNKRINEGRIDIGAYEFIGGTCSGPLFTLRDGSWNDPTIWSCGRLPTSLDNVVIQPTHTVLLDSTMAEAVCHNLEILGTFSMQGCSILINDTRITVDQDEIMTK